MPQDIKLLSTDFDGTLFAEFEKPPISLRLQQRIADLQAKGVRWVINTGRDMSSLMDALARSQVLTMPDYMVVVEREIHVRKGNHYIGLDDWNLECHRSHERVFAQVRRDLPRLVSWVECHHSAMVYEDAYSPFCLLAQKISDADAVQAYLEDYCTEVPDLQVVRNDVYVRFAHANYDKGLALAEILRRESISPDSVFAAGDHLNDLAMLKTRFARFLAAPANAIDPVKTVVSSQGGFVSDLPFGHGVMQGLDYYLS